MLFTTDEFDEFDEKGRKDDMNPFIRRNKGFDLEDAVAFLEMVATSKQTKGDEICKEIEGSKSKANCDYGTWIKFDQMNFKLTKYGKYLWIQNPNCYAEEYKYSLYEMECEIVIHKYK